MSTASTKGSKTIIVAPGGETGDQLSKPVRKIVGWLITFTWRQEGEDFKIFEGRNLLSADPKADIYVSDPAISTPHCMILYRGGKLLIKDELSTNGTFLNGEAIEEGELKDGDILKVGTTELKFRSIN